MAIVYGKHVLTILDNDLKVQAGYCVSTDQFMFIVTNYGIRVVKICNTLCYVSAPNELIMELLSKDLAHVCINCARASCVEMFNDLAVTDASNMTTITDDRPVFIVGPEEFFIESCVHDYSRTTLFIADYGNKNINGHLGILYNGNTIILCLITGTSRFALRPRNLDIVPKLLTYFDWTCVETGNVIPGKLMSLSGTFIKDFGDELLEPFLKNFKRDEALFRMKTFREKFRPIYPLNMDSVETYLLMGQYFVQVMKDGIVTRAPRSGPVICVTDTGAGYQ